MTCFALKIKIKDHWGHELCSISGYDDNRLLDPLLQLCPESLKLFYILTQSAFILL